VAELLAASSLVLSLISIASLVYFAGYKISGLQVKVDTMWAFQMRRAFGETVERGLGTMNSPLEIKSEAWALLEPLREALQAAWSKNGLSKLSDADALLEIETKFGPKLLSTVCLPAKLSYGACLIVALAVAKNTTRLDVTL
jgi:hypothetical protein